MQKTFLLCVGAQKAGTTWLHDHLRNHPNADMGFAKEYHILDALFVREFAFRQRFLQERIRRVVGPGAKPGRTDLQLLRFIGDPDAYFDYFRALLDRRPYLHLTGDITPSYSALPEEGFAFARAGLLARGFRVRVVFLLRDPVERCLSAVRMQLRDRGSGGGADEEAAGLRQSYATEAFMLRTRYDRTLHALDAVFSPDEMHCEFFESLFTDAAIRRLSAFLGISEVPARFDRQLNVSGTGHPLPDALRREVFEHYLPVYRCIAGRVGADALAAQWDSYRRFGP